MDLACIDLNDYRELMLKRGITNPPDIEDIVLDTETVKVRGNTIFLHFLECKLENNAKASIPISQNNYSDLKELQEEVKRKRFIESVKETFPDSELGEHRYMYPLTMKTPYGDIKYHDVGKYSYYFIPDKKVGTLEEVIAFVKRYTELCKEFDS